MSGRAALVVALAMPAVACTGSVSRAPDALPGGDARRDHGASGEGGLVDGAGDGLAADAAPPPYSCTLPAVKPTLSPRTWQHPAAPRAGQTVTLSLQSRIDPKPGKPHPLTTTLRNRAGQRTVTSYDVAGGKYWIYHIPVAGLTVGENCIVVRRGGNVEAALKVKAPPAAAIPRGNGVWKVKRNHQWTCAEQPTYGNFLRVRVLDPAGKPVEGAKVRIRWTDDTQYPVGPDKSATSWGAHKHPKQLVTGADGRAALWTPWGEGIRTPIDARPAYLLFLLDVLGGASDTAMEITSGLWEANTAGCNYCGSYGVNVYGHWSYSVEFRRDPGAIRVCEVPTDHAGQKKCAHNHIYHDPARPACQPVAP